MSKLSFGWRLSRYLAILTQPFLPFSAQRLWEALGESGDVSQADWNSAIDWNAEYKWNDAEQSRYSRDWIWMRFSSRRSPLLLMIHRARKTLAML